ncbi:MAG: DUF4179 domain-containing protein [Clostridia bacterium]|nr:DUF4179 domain-containing protein [Clostridia bacterium]
MKNKDYIEQMNNIHASEDLIQKTIKSISNIEHQKRGYNFKKFIAGTAAALTLTAGSVGAYKAITGNSIMSLFGLGKASINYENQSIKVSDKFNTVIENEYTRIELDKIACDKTFLILEYNVKIKDRGDKNNYNDLSETYKHSKAETEYDYSQGGKSENLGLSEMINVNGKYLNCYTCFAQKIDGKENEYKLYDIIDLMDIDNYTDIRASITILSVICEGEQFFVTNENNNYLINLNITQDDNNQKNIEEHEVNNVKVGVKNVMNTSFATYVTIGVKVSNISSENCLNNIDFESTDSNNNKIESNVFLNKYIVRTKDGYVYDVINDNENYKETDYHKAMYLLNSKNKEQARNKVNFNTDFENADVEMEYVIVYPEAMNDQDTIKCKMYRNDNVVIEDMVFDISKEKQTNTSVSSIELINYTDKKSNDFIISNEKNNKEINKNYNPDAEKIDLYRFPICGISIGMSENDAINELNNYYKKSGFSIQCENYYNDGWYDDGNLSFGVTDGHVSSINVVECKKVMNEKVNINDLIKTYYSEEYLIRDIEHDSQNTIATLYGSEDFFGNRTDSDTSFGYVNLDGAGRITMACYVEGRYRLILSADPATGIVENIQIFML